MFYDEPYEKLAKNALQASEPEPIWTSICLPKRLSSPDLRDDEPETKIQDHHHINETDVAYLHHTSGTSTGVPKPIPQSHRAAIGVLPVFDDRHEKASFSTTPLYHGGVADCFRAWTSGALIWLFPGNEVPITAANILKCLETTRTCAERKHVPRVKYFSSVPYVLQMVASEDDGLHTLKDMDIVGIGGAALTQDVGNDLVAKGINLISRFGSAECGFLMSSHRDYAHDKEWSYLRSRGSSLLRFDRRREDGLGELIVDSHWPHMAKRNVEDGSYATSDLFQPHPTIDDAWRYHSRADSQLTLITGKKFDPAPLEDAIATLDLVNDVFVFGNGQQYPGALLFRSAKTARWDDEELVQKIWPSIQKLNAESQDHARLSRSMLVVMSKDAPSLAKSSKGTIIRGEVESTFKKVIRETYEGPMAADGLQVHQNDGVVADGEVSKKVLDIVKQVTAKSDPIPVDADLFSYGVDSVACMQIRGLLQSHIIGRKIPALPLNVVYDNGNIGRLAQFLVKFRKGQAIDEEDEVELMQNLVNEYSDLSSAPKLSEPSAHKNDGPANFPGQTVVSAFRWSSKVITNYCARS